MRILCCFCLTVMGAFVVAGNGVTPKVAETAPVIDGVFDAMEWAKVEPIALAGDGKLFLLQKDDQLYIAIRSRDKVPTNMYLSYQGKIYVLHASASVGTAVYVENEGKWYPEREYEWRCHNICRCEIGQGARDAFKKAEGWIANTVMAGDGETMEFQIDTKMLGGDAFAMSFVQLGTGVKWPKDLIDDSLNQQLNWGNEPGGLAFEPKSWSKVEMKPQ